MVSQSSSGNGVQPRVLLDENKDGIFEGEKIVAEQLNTCHGLFYASRTTLYANCRGEVPGDPPLPPEPQCRTRRTGGASGRRPGGAPQQAGPADAAGRTSPLRAGGPASTSWRTPTATT